MGSRTVAVTGGNGKIGEEILRHLGEGGYSTVNLARGKRREEVSDTYITTDLLDAGETYGALAKTDADAVIHMGTIPHPQSHADHVVYESNVMSTMHVLEASGALDIDAVCLASSINAMGSDHQARPIDVRWLPMDEPHPRTPDDSYGISKHVLEVTAEGFARRPSNDLAITALRYPWVATVEGQRENFLESDRSLDALLDMPTPAGRDALFSYLDIRDAARIARLCIEAEFDDHEVFWAVADDTTADVPTAQLIEEVYPDVERHREFEGHEALIDTSKAERLLGWTPRHSWRDL